MLLTTSGCRLGSVMLAGLGSRDRPGYLQTQHAERWGYDSCTDASGCRGNGFDCDALSILEVVGDIDLTIMGFQCWRLWKIWV